MAGLSWLAILLYNTEIFLSCQYAPVAAMSACCFLLATYAILRSWYALIMAPILLICQIHNISLFLYHAPLNANLLQNILGAPLQEWMLFVTWKSVLGLVLCLLLIGAFLHAVHRVLKREKSFSLMITSFLILLASIAARELTYPLQFRQSNDLITWPIGTCRNLSKISSDALSLNRHLLLTVENLPSPASKPTSISTLQGNEGVICLLHIGESVRADRLSINGYTRDTTPWLRTQQRIINFPHCVASSAYTFNAVPTILTNARRHILFDTNPQTRATCGSVADLFSANHFRSFFHMHDRPSGSAARENAENNMDSLFGKLMKSLCSSADDMIRVTTPIIEQPTHIKELIDKTPGENLFIIINNVGSHYPYEMYDLNNPVFTPSSPEAYHKSPQTDPLAAEQQQGAYDNTIHYMDEFIRRLLTNLSDKPVLYLYVSDHGEYLGHDGKWGRAYMGAKETEFYKTSGCKVPLFIYTTPAFEELHPHFKNAITQLNKNTDVYTGHEHVFHTLLGIFGIQSEYYNKNLDLSNPEVLPYTGPNPDNK